MGFLQTIQNVFSKPKNRVLRDVWYSNWSQFVVGTLPFGEPIFHNIVEILTDLANDVTLTPKQGQDLVDFSLFKKFYDMYGQEIMNRYFDDGYVVIGLPYDKQMSYSILRKDKDFTISTDYEKWRVVPTNRPVESLYVIKSETFERTGQSDMQYLWPYIKYLDNLFNSSNTMTERMGTMIVASPKNLSNAPTSIVLTEEDKKEIEKDMSENYGTLSRQKQVMLLPREMNFQQMSFANIDTKLIDKTRLAVEVIADRIKVPACRIAVIDANSSKALANGSEQIAGDILLYKSFERLLDKTFLQMARDLKIKLDYTIYGKPADTTGVQATQQNTLAI